MLAGRIWARKMALRCSVAALAAAAGIKAGMAACPNVLAGWYAAWIPNRAGPRDQRVLFGFRDQDHELVVEYEHRVVPLSHPPLKGMRLVGPFPRPDAALAALDLSRRGARVRAG